MRKTLNLTLGIPMYNSARWLPNLLRSLRAQSILPSEIIFLDDASPDRSRDIAEDFMWENPEMNIQVRRNEKNLGIAGSYNALASLATTPWIQIMDADDFFPGEFFAFLEKHTVEDVVAIVTSMRSNITAISLLNVLFAWLIPTTLPKFLPMLGSLAARGGTIYSSRLLKAHPFIDPLFDGSDLIHFYEFRQLGKCIYEPRAKVFYVNHSASRMNTIRDDTYSNLLRKRKEIPATYYIDYLLRKRIFAFVRR